MSDKRQPWMKWYPADWRAEAKIRLCSLAARGLWAEMLFVAHDADPYGHVLVNGRIPTSAQLAVQVGAVPKEVDRLLAELEAAGVFSRNADGAIYSRRMVRDREKADRDAANGKGGGNPRLKGPVKAGVNPPVKPTVGQGDKAQKPEAISHKPDSTAAPPEVDWLDRVLPLLGWDKNDPKIYAVINDLRLYRDAGYDLEKHVVPVIVEIVAKRKASGKPPIGSLLFFKSAIAERFGQQPMTPAAEAEYEPPISREAAIQRVLIMLEGGPIPAAWGSRVGEEGCRIPQAIVDEAKARKAAA